MRFIYSSLICMLVLVSACNALTIAFSHDIDSAPAAHLVKRADATTTTATSAATLLPLNSKCTSSASCASGYCGKSTCQARAEKGASCYKNAGCTSRLCDTSDADATKHTCVDQSTEELLFLAVHGAGNKPHKTRSAALAAFGPGSVLSYGPVTSQTNGAIRFKVDGTHPAALQDTLEKSYRLPDAQRPTHELVFSLASHAFQRATGAAENSACAVTVLYNGAALSLPIKVSNEFKKPTERRFLLAPDVIIDDVAFTVTCDDLTKATLVVSDVKVHNF